jgi:hypothetical protein
MRRDKARHRTSFHRSRDGESNHSEMKIKSQGRAGRRGPTWSGMLPSGTPAIATQRPHTGSSHDAQEIRSKLCSHWESSPSNKHEKQGGPRGSPASIGGFPSNEKQVIAQDRVDVAHGKVTDVALKAGLGHSGYAPGAISLGRACYIMQLHMSFVGPPAPAGPLALDVLQEINCKNKNLRGWAAPSVATLLD